MRTRAQSDLNLILDYKDKSRYESTQNRLHTEERSDSFSTKLVIECTPFNAIFTSKRLMDQSGRRILHFKAKIASSGAHLTSNVHTISKLLAPLLASFFSDWCFLLSPLHTFSLISVINKYCGVYSIVYIYFFQT